MSFKVREYQPGKWHIVYHFQGRRWTRKVASTKKETERICAELEKRRLAEGFVAATGYKVVTSRTALAVFADKWVDEVRDSGLKPATKDSYIMNIERHIKPWFGNMPLDDVTYTRVKEFVNDKLHERYKRSSAPDAKERHYSRDTIRVMVATLRALLAEAVREEIIDKNPVHELGRLYSGADKLHEQPDPMSKEELHKIEDAAGEWLPFLMFQTRTGVRVGEALALQWRDIDFDTGNAFIRRTKSVSGRIGSPKTASSVRRVKLSPELLGVLRRLHVEQQKYWLARGEEIPEWVFCKGNRNPPDYSVWRRAFTLLQQRVDVRVRRPHDLRHTWATLALTDGKPINWVAAQLGHKSSQVTLSVYAHWVKDDDSIANDFLDRKLTSDEFEIFKKWRESGGH